MNPLFYPSNSKARESKSGLEKHRKIIQYSDTQSKEAIRDNIPDSWFYNNKNATKIWESLEVDPAVKFEPVTETKSPFAKIDESASKIRQMILSYEISDQELLVSLMNILEQEDEFFGNYNDDDALFEAKLRLGSMINDHSGNSEAQEKMLDSLRAWFESLNKKSQLDNDGEFKSLKDTYNVDVKELAEMINSSFENREVNSEQLQLLHRSVVDNLTRQIRDMRRKITEQEETIDELNKTIETQKNLRKRQMMNLQKDEKDIMNYQRTICEKDAKIVDLKSTITEIAVEAKPVRIAPPEESKPPEKEEISIADSIERDFEYDTRIRSMAATITSLKQELNDTILQLRNEKQNSFNAENKMNLLDRTKKSIEQSLSSTNERYALLEKKLKDKTDEFEKLQKSLESTAVIEAINETKREYEEKIQVILDNNRMNVSKAVENVEKRYKKQISELMKTVEAGETQNAINELNNQHINEISIIRKECQDEIENLRLSHGNRLNLLTKHYETKIGQMINEHKKLQQSIEKDREMYVEEKRIQIEEDFSRKMIDFQDQAATDLSDLRSRFEAKIAKLEEKLRIIESERDLMKGIIEDNDLLDELPNNFDDTNIDEDEDDEDDDDVLADSILQLKKREIEKSVSERYSLLLKAQRQCIEQAKNWEIEKLKDNFQTEKNEKLYDLRHGVMDNLCQLRILLTSNQNEDKDNVNVDKAILSTLELVQKQDTKIQDSIERQSIPLNEVESRLSECNEKINDLSGENEFLRFTLKQLNNGKDLKDDKNEDLIRAMRSSLAEQANQMSQTLREYDDMKARIEYYEKKEQNVKLSDDLVQTDNDPRIFVKKSFLIFSREGNKNILSEKKLNNDDDDNIILRDNMNSGRAKRQRTFNKNSSRKDMDADITNIDSSRDYESLIDASTQTELIPATKSRKKIKKAKNNSASNELATQSTQNVTAERSTNSDNNHKQEETNKPNNDNSNEINQKQNNQTEKNQKQLNQETQKQSTEDNKKQSIDKEEDNDKLKIAKEQTSNNDDHENKTRIESENMNTNINGNEKQNENIENEDDEYEYEYEDSYPQFVKLTRLNFAKNNCIFEVRPPISPDAYIVECPNCHQNVSFDPQISEVSSTVDPVIECPHCHNSITIDKEKYPIMFQDDYCNVSKSIPLTPEEHSQIATMEESIQKQIQDLIKMKQKIRKDNSNENNDPHFRDDLEPSLPTAILSLPTSESLQSSEKQVKYNQNTSIDLQVSSDSLAIEIPSLISSSPSRKTSSSPSRQNPTPPLSSHSFTGKLEETNGMTKSQEGQINDAEQKIDKEIAKLIEYKQALLSKKNSTKNSKMNSNKNSNTNSDNEDEKSTQNNKSSHKLKLEEMPHNEGSTVIENIASDLHMSDVQLQRTAKTPESANEDNYSSKKVVSFSSDQQSNDSKKQISSNNTSYMNKMKLTISKSVSFAKSRVQSTVNDYLRSLAIQTVSEIDVSIESNSDEPIKKLETIEKAVLTLSNLKAFSSSDENQILATNIIQKAQSLKDIDPSQISSEEVDEVVQSARKLLVSLCHENELDQVNIKPLSTEAGGFLTDDVEKLRDENLKYQNEIIVITEAQRKLKEEAQDLSESTKELKLKHEEIIFSLQKLIDNIVKSIQQGEGKLDSNNLNTLKDQAKYLIGSIKEKENLETDNQETNQLLKERDIEIISLNHSIQTKEGQIQDLSSKLSELTAHIESINLHNQGQQFNVENLEQIDKENKKIIDSMSETIFKMKGSSEELQKKLDQLELANQNLQNRMLMRESDSPVSYSFISPFLIFDTDIESALPSKGFTLIPGKNKFDQTQQQQQQQQQQANENQTEKIRVKYNQSGQNQQMLVSGAPKLVVPKTSQSRSRLGSKNTRQSNFGRSTNNNDPGYVDFVPVHGEDPRSFMYIRKALVSDNMGCYYDRNPVSGNVVLQKTVTNLNRRILSLQMILQSKSHEIIKLRDQKSESRQNLYKTTMQLQKTQKELTRAQTRTLLADEKLEKAFKIIEERNVEIKELRDLIRQLRAAAAQPALMHNVMSNIAEDQSNLAAMRAFRGQSALNEVNRALLDDSPILKRFAQRQMMVVKRWEKRRKELIRQQQNHLLAVLAGMSLVSQKPISKTSKKDKVNEDVQIDNETIKKFSKKRASITVTPMSGKKRSKAKAKKNAATTNQNNNSNGEKTDASNKDFDSSWKNANSAHPKIPAGMKDGVIAQPL